jgi:hypothetical protein
MEDKRAFLTALIKDCDRRIHGYNIRKNIDDRFEFGNLRDRISLNELVVKHSEDEEISKKLEEENLIGKQIIYLVELTKLERMLWSFLLKYMLNFTIDKERKYSFMKSIIDKYMDRSQEAFFFLGELCEKNLMDEDRYNNMGYMFKEKNKMMNDILEDMNEVYNRNM